MEKFNEIVQRYENKIFEIAKKNESLTGYNYAERERLNSEIQETIDLFQRETEVLDVQNNTAEKVQLLMIENNLINMKNNISISGYENLLDYEPEDSEDPLSGLIPEFDNNVEEEKTGSESELINIEWWETNSEEVITNETANEIAKKMYSEGYSELYILAKMYSMGCVPKKPFQPWLFNTIDRAIEWRPMQSFNNHKQKLVDRIAFLTTKEKEKVNQELKNLNSSKDISLRKRMGDKLMFLSDMENDLKSGKITKTDFIEKYWKKLETFEGKPIKITKMNAENLSKTVTQQIDKHKKSFGEAAKELNEIKKDTETKLKKLDEEAKFDTKNTKKYQNKSRTILKENNTKMLQIEQKVWLSLSKVSKSEIETLQKTNPMIDKMIKANWNSVDKFLSSSKAGKLMLWASLATLVLKGVNWYMTDDSETLKQVWLEVWDLAVGMAWIPGNIYDITTAITGEWIAGNLSTTDRIIRWAVGTVCLAINAGSWIGWPLWWAAGAGVTTAIEWAVKAWTKTWKVIKTTSKIAKWANVAQKWIQIATYGYLWYSLITDLPPMAVGLYDAVKWWSKEAEKALTPDIPIKI